MFERRSLHPSFQQDHRSPEVSGASIAPYSCYFQNFHLLYINDMAPVPSTTAPEAIIVWKPSGAKALTKITTATGHFHLFYHDEEVS